jgi:hypothetical protein
MLMACHRFTPVFSRRELLRQSAAGFGYLALADLLTRADAAPNPRDPQAAQAPHFTPRAKRVIFLFMHGGPSQVDTFDHKPLLDRDHGKPLPFPRPRVVSAPTGNLLRSPWKFHQYGQSGSWISDLFPEVAKRADDLCFIHSMHGSNSRHGGALLELHTGSDTFVRPSVGSWVTYGLGTENQNLPGFITICPTLTHGGVNNFSSAFLSAAYQGTALGNAATPPEQVKFSFIKNEVPTRLQRLELDLRGELDQEQLAQTGPDPNLEGRIAAFEMAYRMQGAAPEVQDLSGETKETLKLYGIDNPATRFFGGECLLARRFAERGVRFIQVTHSYKWDQHINLRAEHGRNALEVDRPIAGLLTDLKRRGLLDDTLVLWGGEFGRTPTNQASDDGRDHNPQGFTMWLAGGGVKSGLHHGATDEYGYYAVDKKVHFHDLHATILHLLGLDHKRLTYRHAGRDFRLTDVVGEVVSGILA